MTPTTPLESPDVDLSALPARDRLPFWQEVVCARLSPSENRSLLDRRSFEARVFSHTFGEIDLHSISAAPCLSFRDSGYLRKRPLEDFFAVYLLRGEFRLAQAERRVTQRPGEIMLYDSTRAFVFESPRWAHGIFIRLPRETVCSRLPEAEKLVARPLRCDRSVARLAANMLRQVIALDVAKHPAVAARIGLSVTDVLTSSFELGLSEPKRKTSDRPLLDGARKFILDRLGDPTLTVREIADAMSVSTRTLNRAFATEGTTAVRYLWQLRFELAHRLLVQGGQRHVSDVALACGFSDFSHFSRTFKARYGIAPHCLLA